MEGKMADCNLELQLHPSSSSSSSSSTSSTVQPNYRIRQQQHQPPSEKRSGGELPLTIFYGGEICAVNVNQHQARSIMLVAGGGRAMDERTRSRYSLQCNSQPLKSLSMKRSLQRFLETRKHRIQSTNPYQDK